MFSMELVIERGQARCPRCVALAEYRFVERERDLIRYEVHCAGCGPYREKLGVALPNLPAIAEPWLPVLPEPKVPVRERVRAAAAVARERSLATSAAAVAGWQALRDRRAAEAVAEPVG